MDRKNNCSDIEHCYPLQLHDKRYWLPLGCMIMIIPWANYEFYTSWSAISSLNLLFKVLLYLVVVTLFNLIFITQIYKSYYPYAVLCLAEDGLAYRNISTFTSNYRCGYLRWGNITAIERYASHSSALFAAIACNKNNAGIIGKTGIKLLFGFIESFAYLNHGDYALIRYRHDSWQPSRPKANTIPVRIFQNSTLTFTIINMEMLDSEADIIWAQLNERWLTGKKEQLIDMQDNPVSVR